MGRRGHDHPLHGADRAVHGSSIRAHRTRKFGPDCGLSRLLTVLPLNASGKGRSTGRNCQFAPMSSGVKHCSRRRFALIGTPILKMRPMPPPMGTGQCCLPPVAVMRGSSSVPARRSYMKKGCNVMAFTLARSSSPAKTRGSGSRSRWLCVAAGQTRRRQARPAEYFPVPSSSSVAVELKRWPDAPYQARAWKLYGLPRRKEKSGVRSPRPNSVSYLGKPAQPQKLGPEKGG